MEIETTKLRTEESIPVVGRYFLVSFAPESGIGEYEFEETVNIFDSVPGRIDLAQRISNSGLGEQLKVGVYFNTLDELLAFCRRECLKYKKNTFYATLFTKRLGKSALAKTLNFLNDPRLLGMSMSLSVLRVLKDVADVRLVAAVVARAHELQLSNVDNCLATELSEITFSHQAIESLRREYTQADTIVVKLQGCRKTANNASPSPMAQE